MLINPLNLRRKWKLSTKPQAKSLQSDSLWPHGQFSRQVSWGGFLGPPARDLSNPGMKLVSLTSPELVGGFFTTKATVSEGHSVVSNSLRPHELYSPWNSLGQNTGVGSLSLLPNPGIELRSPALWAYSLPAEPQGKPKNIGVGSLCFLQQIFLTQELNPGLLHYRQILYQLSHQWSGHLGNPVSRWSVTKSLCNEYVCLQQRIPLLSTLIFLLIISNTH